MGKEKACGTELLYFMFLPYLPKPVTEKKLK